MDSNTKIVLLNACYSESLALQSLEKKANRYQKRINYMNKLIDFDLKRKPFIYGVIDSLKLAFYQNRDDSVRRDIDRCKANVKRIQKRINYHG